MSAPGLAHQSSDVVPPSSVDKNLPNSASPASRLAPGDAHDRSAPTTDAGSLRHASSPAEESRYHTAAPAGMTSADKKDAEPSNGRLDAPERHHDTLEVPAQGSQQPSTSSAALTGATVSDSAESIGRRSQRSAGAGRREGSTTSSQRTARARRRAAAEEGPPVPGKEGSDELAAPQRQKKSGLSRFFATLACCGSSDHTSSVDTEGPLVPSKQSELPPARARQSTPAVKQEQIELVPHTTKSTDFVEDKSSRPRDSERTEVSSVGQLPAEELPMAEKHLAQTEPKTLAPHQTLTTAESNPKELPPPSLPGTSEKIEDTPAAPSSDAKAVMDAPVPGPSAEEAQAAEDSDVEMVDAPSSPQEEAPREVPVIAPPRQIDLPPPPPLADRNPQPQPPPPSHESSRLTTPLNDKQRWLLPPIQPQFKGKKCLVLDLDETLVHSSFKILHQADFTIPVEIEGQYHNVYVIKRPGVDQFMKRVGELYEVVVFTASVSKYGDPLLDQLDIHNVVHHRLFRESCYNHQGNYVKDLSQVGRDLQQTIIIDNSPTSYIFHPQHAVPISSWFSDAHDNELLDLIPVLEDLAGDR
ncbi:MAG: hypothetical protein M4579_005930, partial [Chaenotheca gracillima]